MPLVAALAAPWAALWLLPGALAAESSVAGIYTCVDAQGRKLTSDRPIPDCVAREQRVLNKDGSVRQVLPPTLSPEEKAAKDAQERRLLDQKSAAADAVRRDRNLMNRFPDEPTHRKAREAALDTVRLAMKATELRQKELARERKPLLDEAEFYKGRALPARLKQQLDANDGAVDAQRQAAATQEAELVRINSLYDAELARLRRLWAGAPAGSLGGGGAPMPAHDLAGSAPALRNASQQ